MNTLIRMTPNLMWIVLIAVILAGLFGCHRPAPYYMYDPQMYNSAPAQESYEDQRDYDQILQHGAGGCAPNFSTGGCL